MARTKPTPRKQPVFHRVTLTLTADTVATLAELSQDASDALGRTISGSAIVRALLRQAAQHGAPVQLFSFIEAELTAGVRWGKRK